MICKTHTKYLIYNSNAFCGDVIRASGAYTCRILDDGTIAFLDIDWEYPTMQLVIPDVIDGHTVTRIGYGVNTWVHIYTGFLGACFPQGMFEAVATELVLLKTVRVIDAEMLDGSDIRIIIYPDSVREIGSNARGISKKSINCQNCWRRWGISHFIY